MLATVCVQELGYQELFVHLLFMNVMLKLWQVVLRLIVFKIKRRKKMNYYTLAFKKMFDFKGRATINEFWYFFLTNILLFMVLGFLRRPLDLPLVLGDILRVVLIIPTLALGFRRLNDAGFNRWLFLIPMINLLLAGFPSKEN